MTAELAKKYGLSESDTQDAVEIAVTRVMTHALGHPVSTVLGGPSGLSITVMHRHAGPGLIDLQDIPGRLQRRIKYEVELELRKRQTVNETAFLAALRGKTITGTVAKLRDNGSLLIAFDLVRFAGILTETYYADCPYHYIPPHERNFRKVGDVNTYFVTSVVPMAKERLSRVRIRVSRTTPELPKLMLTERTGLEGIQCTKRIPGAFSEIWVPKRIPKQDINEVGKDLRERLDVRVSR